MPTWIMAHPILALAVFLGGCLIGSILVLVIRNTWWRVWYPAQIFILGMIIKRRERKHAQRSN
jgi:hypothetical protein